MLEGKNFRGPGTERLISGAKQYAGDPREVYCLPRARDCVEEYLPKDAYVGRALST